MTQAPVPRNRGVRMLNKNTEPWNGGYALTGKRKYRMAISIFGTMFLVFFGVGFLMFRPHGTRAVLRLAVGVIVFFAVSFALGEAVNFMGRKLREWTERMERASGTLGAERDLAIGNAEAQDTGFLYDTGLMYLKGQSVPQGYAKAALWF